MVPLQARKGFVVLQDKASWRAVFTRFGGLLVPPGFRSAARSRVPAGGVLTGSGGGKCKGITKISRALPKRGIRALRGTK